MSLTINTDQQRAGWIRILLWLFCFSFAFDFRGEGGGSVLQMGFLGLALLSGGAILLLGIGYLQVLPGAFLIALWWGYLVSTAVVAVCNEVEFGRYLRVITPFLLCGLGIAGAHIAACHGMKLEQIVAAVLAAAVVNVMWRACHGVLFREVTVETVRTEILSPSLNWLSAYIGCALLLRRSLSWLTFLVIGLVATVIFFSVTRGPLLPLMCSAGTAFGCLLLALKWRIVPVPWAGRRVLTLSLMGGVLIVLLAGALVTQPEVLERWTERLFNQAGGVTSKDVSWLTREAEAKAMWDILSENPVSFAHGKGIGSGFYWDPSYYPELYLVYPDDFDFTEEFWFAGHSVWTYALFSGGVPAVLLFAVFFCGLMALTLRSVYLNKDHPGFRMEFAFLPLVAAWCLLSESATSNPFDERFAGLIFGLMAGLPQVLFNRAYARHWRPAAAAVPPAVSQHTPTAPHGAVQV